MAMTKSAATSLASFVHIARPEWDFHGVMAALAKIAALDPITAAQTALAATGDPQALTPMAMTNPTYRPEWRPATAAEAAQQRAARARKIADRKVTAQLQSDRQAADPDASHRGYVAAAAAFRTAKATRHPAIVDPDGDQT